MISLGSFELDFILGHGGMGEVWKGVHKEEGIPVAVKILTGDKAQNPLFQAAFRNEIHSVSRLSHPNIVIVFDYGRISLEESERSGGRLEAGAAYLVMELADGGSLRPFCGRLPWERLRVIFLSLLDALSHAHARMVIHRDLKPENVLLRKNSSDAMILTDFGLAHALERESHIWEQNKALGTFAYMAPEQFENNWRNYGAWTDLYGFGCLAYALISGHPPFGRGLSFEENKQLHLYQAVPPLETSFQLPKKLDNWLKRLLEKEPTKRFQCAADAMWALRHLSEKKPQKKPQKREVSPQKTENSFFLSEDDVIRLSRDLKKQSLAKKAQKEAKEDVVKRQDIGGLNTLELRTLKGLNTLELRTLKGLNTTEIRSLRELGSHKRQSEKGQSLAQCPDTWRKENSRIRRSLSGVGLGLYGLRSIPLVGRENEQDFLWKILKEVVKRQSLQIVLVRGASGSGKSHLGRWLCERAYEVGAAYSFKVVHTALGSSNDGISAAIARYLRCRGLPRSEILSRVKNILKGQGVRYSAEWHGLTELLSPAKEADILAGARFIHFSNINERYSLQAHFLERLTRERPVILFIDDVQWGLDALSFISYLLDMRERRELPLLILLNVQTEALAERAIELDFLKKLQQDHDIREIELGSLSHGNDALLIQELLRLDKNLEEQVKERVAGNPLFTVQLIEDWVQRGLLQTSVDGFFLKDDAEVEFPDNLYQIWQTKLDGIFVNRGNEELIAFELAAALGKEVETSEWKELCQYYSIEIPEELLEIFIKRHLIIPNQAGIWKGWTFVHNMMREALERQSKEAQRWKKHHYFCAKMLKHHGHSRSLVRRGEHLLLAGEKEKAFVVILSAVRERLSQGAYRTAEQFLHKGENILGSLDIDVEDSRWGELWLLWSMLEQTRGDYEKAQLWAKRTAKSAKQHGWLFVRVYALWILGRNAALMGDVKRARHLLAHVKEMAVSLDKPVFLLACLHNFGRVLTDLGEFQLAQESFQAALQKANFEEVRSFGAELEIARSLLGMGRLTAQLGDLEYSENYVKQAYEQFKKKGARLQIADSFHLMGVIARLRKNLTLSEKYYQKALDIYRDLGVSISVVTELHLGLLLIDYERFQDAFLMLERSLISLKEYKRHNLLMLAHLGLLVCLGKKQDWGKWVEHFTFFFQTMRDYHFVDVDLAQTAQKSAKIAEKKEPQRACMLYKFSLAQWQKLNAHDQIIEVKQALSLLDK